MQTGGETVIGGVLRLNRLFQGVDAHNAKDRTEVFDEVVLAARFNAGTDPRAPQAVRLIEATGSDLPLLPGLQGRQTPQELPSGFSCERPHLGAEIIGPSDLQGAHGVEQLIVHPLGEADASHEDHIGSGRALLPRMTECGVHDVLYREVEVG